MFVDQVLLQAVVMALSLGAYLAYMLSLHVGLTLACLASTPLLWFTSSRFSRLVQPAYLRNRELVDAMIQRLAENIKGMQVVKAFAREPDEMERFRKINEAVREQKRWIFKKIALFTPTVGFLSQLNLVVLLGYGGTLVIQGKLPLGTGLVAFATIPREWRRHTGLSANCPTTTTPCSGAEAGWVFPAGNASVWPSPGRSCSSPPSCCWMIRQRRSIPAPSTRSWRRWNQP